MRIGFIGGPLGYRILRSLWPHGGSQNNCSGARYLSCNKLEILFGPDVWREIQDKVVIDYGCGPGLEAVEFARRGARRVIGIDIQSSCLELGRATAKSAGEDISARCMFTTHTDELADVIFSTDSFEHFEKPKAILRDMARLIKPGGRLFVSFGPPWFHPLGGHLFSVFPWAHLIFSERALIRWRSEFKSDGATRFGEVAGGLNQMTIRRFKRLIDGSEFKCERFEAVPIRKLRLLSNPLAQEFMTSIVRCVLLRRAQV